MIMVLSKHILLTDKSAKGLIVMVAIPERYAYSDHQASIGFLDECQGLNKHSRRNPPYYCNVRCGYEENSTKTKKLKKTKRP